MSADKFCKFVARALPGYGIIDDCGLEVPEEGTPGYATGCTFRHLDGGVNTALYVNEGNKESCDFNAV